MVADSEAWDMPKRHHKDTNGGLGWFLSAWQILINFDFVDQLAECLTCEVTT